MKGQLQQEIEVGVSASTMWDIYGSLQLPKLISQLLSDVVGTVEVVEGDGGVGTILKISTPQGTPFIKEIYTVVDDERHIKEAEHIEGEYINLGFLLYRVRVEILNKDNASNTSTVRSTIEFKLDDEHRELSPLVSTTKFLQNLQTMTQVIGKYLADQQKLHN